jgi:hypothetical protein
MVGRLAVHEGLHADRSGQREAGPQEPSGRVRLPRLIGASAVTIVPMMGMGRFITLLLLLRTMGRPQAMLGWFIDAVVGGDLVARRARRWRRPATGVRCE